jgi:N-terminal domain of galactosyltransferase
MVFLSAQPDDYYFLWQLELQLHNFHLLGIPAGQIHVLIGYHPQRGLRHEFRELMTDNSYAMFFAYPDNREHKAYPPSIRPHIMRQHFEAHPSLEKTVVFFHDADIIFRALPDFPGMAGGDHWYVADTCSYMDSQYIKNAGSEELFLAMCAVTDIAPEQVIANDANAGGAQYVIKNASAAFWKKVERDSEVLYGIMLEHDSLRSDEFLLTTGKKKSEYHGIQSWCADMWAINWNALRSGHTVKIHPELDFCWPQDPIAKWHEKKILHYAGVSSRSNAYFAKVSYIHYPPFHEDLRGISAESCSYPLARLIAGYAGSRAGSRENLRDVSFLLPVRIDSPDRAENLSIIIRCLNKYFDTHIIILEADETAKIDNSELPGNCQYIFVKDGNPLFHRTKYNNQLVRRADTSIVGIYDTDVVFPPDQIISAVYKIRREEAEYVSPYSGDFVSVDPLFKKIFSKLLDPDVLTQNLGKFTVGARRSYGGAAFMHKQSFMRAGGDNERITSWGPEDVERPKRMNIAGYRTERINGPLFHLPHQRGINSTYTDMGTRVMLMEEYLKICSMSKLEMEEYINSWP